MRDGLIEGRQHQTYDQDYYGANTMVGSLYLGALRAAEEMAARWATWTSPTRATGSSRQARELGEDALQR